MKSGRPFPLPCAVDYMYIPESGPSLSEQCPICRQRNHEFSQKTSIDRKKQQIQCVTYGSLRAACFVSTILHTAVLSSCRSCIYFVSMLQ
ncbi:unnamed protein product [Sphagnum jensenii]|uniref:Uncharacterized protein n=1 Tax=Sphagnum jensenii TaxID=128206 RepID=A0ABP1AHX4_9BRYO